MRIRRGEVTNPELAPGPRVDMSLTPREARYLTSFIKKYVGRTTNGYSRSVTKPMATLIDRVLESIDKDETTSTVRGESQSWEGYEPGEMITDEADDEALWFAPMQMGKSDKWTSDKRRLANFEERLNAVENKQMKEDGRDIPARVWQIEQELEVAAKEREKIRRRRRADD